MHRALPPLPHWPTSTLADPKLGPYSLRLRLLFDECTRAGTPTQAALWGSLLEEYRDKLHDLKELRVQEKRLERERGAQVSRPPAFLPPPPSLRELALEPVQGIGRKVLMMDWVCGRRKQQWRRPPRRQRRRRPG